MKKKIKNSYQKFSISILFRAESLLDQMSRAFESPQTSANQNRTLLNILKCDLFCKDAHKSSSACTTFSRTIQVSYSYHKNLRISVWGWGVWWGVTELQQSAINRRQQQRLIKGSRWATRRWSRNVLRTFVTAPSTPTSAAFGRLQALPALTVGPCTWPREDDRQEKSRAVKHWALHCGWKRNFGGEASATVLPFSPDHLSLVCGKSRTLYCLLVFSRSLVGQI